MSSAKWRTEVAVLDGAGGGKGRVECARRVLLECNAEARMAVGFDAALVGVGRQFSRYLAVYDYAACVNVLVARGFSREAAVEHMEFNVVGMWWGAGTPVFVYRPVSLCRHHRSLVDDCPREG